MRVYTVLCTYTPSAGSPWVLLFVHSVKAAGAGQVWGCWPPLLLTMSAAIWPFYVICWSWSGVGLAVTTPTHHECCYLATLCELLKLVRCGTGGHHSYSTHHECCYLSTLCELLELVRCGAGGHHAAGDGVEGDRPPVVSDHHLVGPAARSGSEHTAGVNNPQRSTSPLLTVEPFAALFCLSVLYLPPPDPAWHHSTAVQAARPYMVMLPVPRWEAGSTLKEAVLVLSHLALIMLCSKLSGTEFAWIL